MAQFVIGLYDDFPVAAEVAQALVDQGFDRAAISIIAHQDQVSAPEPASVWASLTLAVPGIGPVLGVGPLAAALSATAGEVAGEGLLRVLHEHGVSADEAPLYAEGVRRGHALVAIDTAEAKAEQARAIMHRAASTDIAAKAAQWRREGAIGVDAEGDPYLAPKPPREATGKGPR